jgi:hypothetical protein
MEIVNVSFGGGMSMQLTPVVVGLACPISTIVEGNTFVITFTTNTPSAYPYTISGVTSADIGNASLTGTFTANGETRTYTVSDDLITEGRETFLMTLDNGQAGGAISIDDSYYTLTANVASANEYGGNVFNITLDTNAIHALPLGYAITGVSNIDFNGSPSLTGNFTSNGQVLTFTANADLLLEGTEYFAISLNNGRANANITINDTSVAYYTLTANRASVNEGNSFTVTFDTNAIDRLPLGYTITGGVSSIDFIGSPSLTGNFTANGQVLTFTANADVSTEGVEYFAISLNNGQANANVLINDTSRLAAGQIEFTTPGTYTWVAPRITKVSVVAVGAGGGGVQGGGSGDGYRGGGGGGGGLVWVNNVSVTAGTTYSVTVGAGGPIDSPTINGGNSWFISNTYIVAAGGGAGQNAANPQAFAGYYINNSGFDGGGGNGGRGGLYGGNFSGSGGGGAGGYTGAGGQGATSGYGASTATAGSGGGGGGGGNFGGYAAGGGGGVGLWGEGANGAAGNNSGQGGFGGSSGLQGGDSSTGTGGRFGGGGGGGTQNSPGRVPIPGSRGGVRIMWSGGTVTYVERAYPSTNTANI